MVAGCGSAPTPSTSPSQSPSQSAAPKGSNKYPGAQTSKDTAQLVEQTTSDDPEKVAAFYEKELGAKAVTMNGLTTIEGTRNGKKTVVAVTKANGQTSISVMTDK
jgi:hypothetical protein